MEKYISKSAVVAEIERRYKLVNKYETNEFCAVASRDELVHLTNFINSLEVKEVDLEKEIDLVEDKYRGFESLSRADVIDVAKHFFELGMRINNPITAADRGTAEEIIVNLKRVEQDYHIDLTNEMEWVRNQVKKGE